MYIVCSVYYTAAFIVHKMYRYCCSHTYNICFISSTVPTELKHLFHGAAWLFFRVPGQLVYLVFNSTTEVKLENLSVSARMEPADRTRCIKGGLASISERLFHRWALWYLWNPWIMPVRGTPCTGTCNRPVGILWVIEPCAYPVRVSVFSQGSCRAILCLGVLPHACTLSKCAPLDYTQVCVALDFLCR